MAQPSFRVSESKEMDSASRRTFNQLKDFIDQTYASVVDTLPTTGLYRGRTVVLTTDMKQYVYYGATTGWLPPWNEPWGSMAVNIGQGALTTSGTTELVLFTSTGFTTPANRRFLITVEGTFTLTVAADIFRHLIRQGSGTGGTAIRLGPPTYNAAEVLFPVTFSYTDAAMPGGTAQWTWTIARIAGTGTMSLVTASTYSNQITVEDIGPSGAAPAA